MESTEGELMNFLRTQINMSGQAFDIKNLQFRYIENLLLVKHQKSLLEEQKKSGEKIFKETRILAWATIALVVATIVFDVLTVIR